jgi:hypothetical protein
MSFPRLKSLYRGKPPLMENAQDALAFDCIDTIYTHLCKNSLVRNPFVNLVLEKYKALGKGALKIQYSEQDVEEYLKMKTIKFPGKYMPRDEVLKIFEIKDDPQASELNQLIEAYDPESELIVLIDLRWGCGYTFMDRLSFIYIK